MKNDHLESDPLHHSGHMKRLLTEMIDHAREDIKKVSEPKFQLLLETTAEVLIGLRTAYEHYETKNEPAMA